MVFIVVKDELKKYCLTPSVNGINFLVGIMSLKQGGNNDVLDIIQFFYNFIPNHGNDIPWGHNGDWLEMDKQGTPFIILNQIQDHMERWITYYIWRKPNMVCVDYIYWSLMFMILILVRVGNWEEYYNNMWYYKSLYLLPPWHGACKYYVTIYIYVLCKGSIIVWLF